MNKLLNIFSIILFFSFVFLKNANARPEYAVKHGYTQCSVCHISPFGGGARRVDGKLYGSKDFETGVQSLQNYFSGDLRAITFFPAHPEKTTNGIALMSAIPAVNIPLTQDKQGVSTHLVSAFNLGGLAPTGVREAYLLVEPSHPNNGNSFFSAIQFGRFNVPFGLMTDEHRTWTRIQSKTSINDFEMGAALSGDPLFNFHYDFALTTGFQNGGMTFSGNKDLPWALILNLRWNPVIAPVILGTSYSRHRTLNPQIDYTPYAYSFYTGLSGHRLTHGSLPFTLLGEFQIARGWNDTNTNPSLASFIPASDTAYQDAIKNSESLGLYLGLDYEISQRWTLQYKFENLVLDRLYTADGYIRHSAGFKWNINSNIILTSRYEIARAMRPGIQADNARAARDAFFTLLHVWL